MQLLLINEINDKEPLQPTGEPLCLSAFYITHP